MDMEVKTLYLCVLGKLGNTFPILRMRSEKDM